MGALALEADAVVLDLDGLLVDSEAAAFDAAREILAELGADLGHELFSAYVGRPARQLYLALVAHFGLVVDVEDLLRRREHRLARFYADPSPMPGAVDFVRRAAAAGTAVGVASSSPAAVVGRAVGALGLTPVMGALVGRDSAAVTAPKPAPDVYLAALGLLGVPPGAAVGVEDSATGAVASMAAGLTTVVVPSAWTRSQTFPPGALRTGSLADLDIRPAG